MQEMIKRINELANKSKTEGLNDDEKLEQTELRAAYIQKFRAGFKDQLLNLKVVDEMGQDVTPEKLRKEQNKKLN